MNKEVEKVMANIEKLIKSTVSISIVDEVLKDINTIKKEFSNMEERILQNKEVEETLKKVLDYAVSPQYENVLILKQAFSDMEFEHKLKIHQMTRVQLSLNNDNIELQSKLDKVREVISYELEPTTKTVQISKKVLLKQLQNIFIGEIK